MEVDRPRLKTAPLATCSPRPTLLITSSRPSSLARLGLDPPALAAQPRLCHVGIVGYAADPEAAGHDLNYQAAAGLVRPSQLPASLLADMAGASARRSRRWRC